MAIQASHYRKGMTTHDGCDIKSKRFSVERRSNNRLVVGCA
jgi:hypothetical protein